MAVSLPFDPLRDQLYTWRELFGGFDAARPDSYAACPDIAILSYFFQYGTNPAKKSGASTMEALHDNSISRSTSDQLKGRTVVAIMGSHGLSRASSEYRDVSLLTYALARQGKLVVSGGGPGAMEAAHLGAFLSKLTLSDLDAAIQRLSAVSALPPCDGLVNKDTGEIDAKIARDLHGWLAPAIAIAASISPDQATPNLGVPTWLYGYEPTSPFATGIAKYFQNSLREDGLVTMGTAGIVYAKGGPGTVQEIFQDAAQNAYGTFCRMVFLSPRIDTGGNFWETTVPVRPMIEALLGKKPEYAKKVLFTDSVDKAASFLT